MNAKKICLFVVMFAITVQNFVSGESRIQRFIKRNACGELVGAGCGLTACAIKAYFDYKTYLSENPNDDISFTAWLTTSEWVSENKWVILGTAFTGAVAGGLAQHGYRKYTSTKETKELIAQYEVELNKLTPQEKRKICALVYAAAGDAAGGVTEFVNTTARIKERFGDAGIQWIDDENVLHARLADGKIRYTDDTFMAKQVLDIYKIHKNDADANAFIDNLKDEFTKMFQDDNYDPYFNMRAHGPTNASSCLYPQNRNHGTEGGCGSVMRAWPIGLFETDPAKAGRLAVAQSDITHSHPSARAACAGVAAGITTLLNETNAHNDEATVKQAVANSMIVEADKYEPPDTNRFDRALFQSQESTASIIKISQTALSKGNMATGDIFALAKFAGTHPGDETSPAIILGATNQRINHRSITGALLGWPAGESSGAMLYLLMRYGSNVDAALSAAINTPGDSDSIASLAGVFCGALNGDTTALLKKPKLSKLESLNEFLSFRDQPVVAAY